MANLLRFVEHLHCLVVASAGCQSQPQIAKRTDRGIGIVDISQSLGDLPRRPALVCLDFADRDLRAADLLRQRLLGEIERLRRAEHDRIVSLAGQAPDRRVYSRGPWIRQFIWVGRLLSAILSAAW